MKKGFFIVGTDTDVGKTVMASALLRAFLLAGHDVRAVKPVQSGGCRSRESGCQAPDVLVYRAAAPDTPALEPLYCYPTPCSPHLAADLEENQVDLAALEAYCRTQLDRGGISLIEGAGGLMTPLNHSENFLDLMKVLDLPVILVADNKLGMINHALMTLEVLACNGLTTAAFIINHCSEPSREPTSRLIREDNINYFRKRYQDFRIIDYPHRPDGLENWEETETVFLPELDHLTASLSRPKVCTDIEKHIWHPYSSPFQEKNHFIYRAAGNHLFGEKGALLDGMASWWCAVHGYNDSRLNRAAIEQINQMSHVMFGGITHEPALKLAKQLLALLPQSFSHLFYCDSGSVSVEVALKMAIQYWQGKGVKTKKKILTVRGGYHGDTFGAMSVCDPDNGMHHMFAGILPEQIFAERPSCRFDEAFDPRSLDNIRDLLGARADEVAAVIIEPIVQGAGGMWFYHPLYLKGLRALCNRWKVLLICDEIATGFGRTGKMFAMEWAGISPDILCVGKGLTGGYLSFAATITTEKVAKGISMEKGVLMHGPTYMGNPLACAVACKNLEILIQSPWQQRVASIESALRQGLEPCRNLPQVEDVRVLGAIGVVQIREVVNQERCRQFFIQEGVWIRPFGHLIYIMPPYTLSDQEVGKLTRAVEKLVEEKRYL